MSIITLPTGFKAPAGTTIGQARYDITESSDSTGADAARLLGPPRWTASLRSIDAMTPTEAGLWEATVLKLRGRVNHLALHDFARPAPEGTLRGSPVLNATAAAGATSIVLASARNGTNLLTYSRAFDSAAWTAINGGTATANTTAAPDGTTTADTITDANGAASAGRRQTITVANDSAAYVGSIFIRKTSGGTSPTFMFQLNLSGGSVVTRTVRINTDLGTVLTGTANVVNYSTDWWRVDATVTNDTSGNTSLRMDLFPAVDAYGGTGSVVATTGSAIVWGAQLELGSTVTDFAAATLKAGDWLQLGTGVGTSQLVKVVDDATAAADGTLTATVEPPLRAAITSGTAVTWDKALAYFKQSSAPQWTYRVGRGRRQGGFGLDLLESWTA